MHPIEHLSVVAYFLVIIPLFFVLRQLRVVEQCGSDVLSGPWRRR